MSTPTANNAGQLPNAAAAAPREPVSPYELAELLGQFPPTPEQAAIISSPLEPLLVIAGAGSGKTTTMADRVVWLVANGLVLPEEILGVTFTRKAAGELASRIRAQLSKLGTLARSGEVELAPAAAARDALEPKVSTYHSYASGIVSDYGLRLGIERDAVVLGAAEAWQLASEVVEGHDGDHEHFTAAKSTLIQSVMDLAGECAEHLQEPESVIATIDGYLAGFEALPYIAETAKPRTAAVAKQLDVLRTRSSVAALVQKYAEAKRRRNALDYGDLVALAARIARDVPHAAEMERQRYKVVLLDEFQDTSHAQLQLFAELFGAGHPVTAVGDPHQSIYGFRGASAGQLFRFPEIFLKADGGYAPTAELTIAWRNSAHILATANVMSAELTAAQARKANAKLAAGLTEEQRAAAGPRVVVSPLREKPQAPDGEVLLARYDTELAEAEAVAEEILERKGDFTHRRGAQGAMTVAVLCRRRAQFARFQSVFEARGIPYEIVGLGGLLGTPEIVDLVATLRVIADPGRSDALMRLLTGARWRIGPADLMAFADWARYLARRREWAARNRVDFDAAVLQGDTPEQAGGAEQLEPVVVTADIVDASSLVEALDYLGPDFWPESARPLSDAARTRLLALRDELRMLRGFVGEDLVNLLGVVEKTMLLDIELAAKPGSSIHHARRHLDAFADAAATFMQAAQRVDLDAFLGWLETAEAEEGGLEMTAVESNPDAVALLTVHASKGLEWDVVFVPGMNSGAFPSTRADRWSTGAKSLPWPLRGDRDDLPVWEVDVPDLKTLMDNEKLFASDVALHGEEEERRLAYVAFTRARDFLMCSSTVWGTGKKPLTVSPFLSELLPLTEGARHPAVLGPWQDDPEEGAENPVSAGAETADWPYDPLNGPVITGRTGVAARVGRRTNVERSAGSVAAASAQLAELAGSRPAAVPGTPDFLSANPRWGAEASVLLAQEKMESDQLRVELPPHISASRLVALGEDPEKVTRAMRRPIPTKPGMAARKGTAFHAWIEDYFATTGQLDFDEEPGADAYVDEAYDLAGMQETFKNSEWATRIPADLEVPIETRVADVVVRGRIDAVFRDADGGWDLIDWKTGRIPSKAQLAVRGVQLAVYRLAWSRLQDAPLEQVRAAFYYVGQDKLIRPVDLAGREELEAIVTGAYTTS
ncbi:DNA helicase-2/ATP-dependent DNA helicase PcrA [Arthrobacter stackebrandtii]|uniref:DNA 3'-5' helicase n=1 Tax=Arthrobacter stackebrandtii TaxID=272161 RepID=A0ABS4Z047_9MICC|nr:ATP-dependent DNA helicase [Arthrobacter stackebrandtii]MBP2413623.1 DNA helicase-2/ATP-dependent DNA helicase PcrA [Arthrobacter stackebrandtii]PYH00558.1 DNA helicase UvrD [Arthrobacter stackebrandtii]